MNAMDYITPSSQCDRLLESIECLRGMKSISEQFQYSTQLLKELDKMFAACGEKAKCFHQQLILKLRSAIKLNCDKELFTEEQIHLLEELAEELRNPELEKEHILTVLDRLIDADLSPLPSLEDGNG